MKRLVFVLLAALFVGCDPAEIANNLNPGEGGKAVPAITLGVNKVSAVSAVLQGKANLASSAASDLTVGFQYSKSSGILPSNSTTVEAVDADSEYNYSTGISELEPNTTYYYRSLLRQNGQDYYGETKSFTTLELSSMLETLDATDMEPTSAKLNARLDLTDVQYKSLSYGFLWGTSEELLDKTLEPEGISENVFTSAMSDLHHKTQYWYKAFATIDGHTFHGDIKTFTTLVVPVTSIELGASEYTFYTAGYSLLLQATVLPADATDKSLIWTSSDESVATVDQTGKMTTVSEGTAIIKATANDGSGINDTCTVTIIKKPGPVPEGAVDLGLSVYWATCNLGTNTPHGKGGSYAWGETETKSDYSWSTYKFGTRSSGPFSKYNTSSSFGTVDNKSVLDPEDDAAHVKLGGSWRIPTDEEWTELITWCTWKWTAEQGATGLRVTGPNGSSIFLPAVLIATESINGIIRNIYAGSLRSSSLCTDAPNKAWHVSYYSVDDKGLQTLSGERYYGLPIRPVSD